VLSLAALGLRLAQFTDDLFADELFTLDDVRGRSLPGVVEHVREGFEDNPPLFFVLAWASAKLGDPTVWIRLPSVVLGTALVPLVYALGARAANRRAGVAAAAIVALSPFTVFYGGEARAYATLMFVSALSTLVLLHAVEQPRGRWWLVYAACACATLYTHYTGVFVLLAQAAWAAWFHRRHLRQLVTANVLALVAYAPWLVTELSKDPTYTKLPALSIRYVASTLTRVLPGHPLVPSRDLPGEPVLVLFVAILLAGCAIAVRRAAGRRPGNGFPLGRNLPLFVLLAAVTPAGVVLVSATGDHNILLARSLSASVPAAAVLVGWLLTSPRAPVAVALTTAALVAVGVGTVQTLDDPVRNVGFRSAARYIEARERPGDAVVFTSFYHHPPHPLAGFVSSYFDPGDLPVGALEVNDRPAWRQAARTGGRVFFVLQPIVVFGRPLGLEARAGPGRCFRLDSRESISDSPPLSVGVYSVPAGERLCARLALLGGAVERTGTRLGGAGRQDRYFGPWFGRRIPVLGAPRGSVNGVSTEGRRIVVTGFLRKDPARKDADWVLVFLGRRLVAAGVPNSARADTLMRGGAPSEVIPFEVTGRSPAPAAVGDLRRLQVLALSGGEAAELTWAGR